MGVKVVLVEPLYETNVGHIARVMKNFGLDDLCIINPRIELGRESRIFAAHAKDVLDNVKISRSLSKAIADADITIGTTARPGKSSRNVLRSTIDPTTVARRAISNKGKVAIVLGRDTTGLSNKELSLCDLTLTIPTNPEYPTMNVSHAAAVIFYELFKVCRKKRNSKERIPDKKVMNRLMGFFNELAARSELPTHRRKLANRAFRNIISRSFITQRETSLLMGVFRKNLR